MTFYSTISLSLRCGFVMIGHCETFSCVCWSEDRAVLRQRRSGKLQVCVCVCVLGHTKINNWGKKWSHKRKMCRAGSWAAGSSPLRGTGQCDPIQPLRVWVVVLHLYGKALSRLTAVRRCTRLCFTLVQACSDLSWSRLSSCCSKLCFGGGGSALIVLIECGLAFSQLLLLLAPFPHLIPVHVMPAGSGEQLRDPCPWEHWEPRGGVVVHNVPVSRKTVPLWCRAEAELLLSISALLWQSQFPLYYAS